MYIPAQGDLLEAGAEALVNPVNTAGVMGKGLALQFRETYPDNYRAYRQACDDGKVQPGRMFVYTYTAHTPIRYIINFPTKRHWRHPSRMEDIESGLAALVTDVLLLSVRSVAVPPLGCGLGGLPWAEVRQRMLLHFSQTPDVEWFVFEPAVQYLEV
jgi:O-acetyl-ADP-ribose deacetylase (regulator of RNase III)